MTDPELHPLAVRLGELSERTARQVLDLLDQLAAGLIRPDQLPELVAVLVKLGGDQAAALAVSELVRELAAAAPGARLPSVTGITGHVQPAAVEQAVVTIMGGAEHNRRGRLDQLARVGFDTLGLQTYLTAGPKEARAWTIHKGWTAPQAAGVIHTDFQRGFIKAEVVSFDELVEAGSMAEAKARGQVRIEGKDYVMADGDVVEFRFNV